MKADFTYTLSSNGQVLFTNTSTGMDSATNFLWSFGDGQQYTGSSTTHLYSYNGTYHVNLYVGDTLGTCFSLITDTIIISNTSNAPICGADFSDSLQSNGVVVFYNQSWGTSANTVYNWNFDGGYTSSAINPSTTYSVNGVYVVSLLITDASTGCLSNYTHTIVVNSWNCTTIARFNYVAGSNGQLNFTNTSSNIPSGVTYFWDFGDGYSSSAVNPSHTFSNNGSYLISLKISDSLNLCSSVYSDSVIITNVAGGCHPTVSFIMHKDSINPQPGIWEISPYYSSQVSGAIWNWGDGSSTNELYPTHTYSAVGQYTICVMVFSSCGDSSYACQNDSLYRLANNNSTNSIIQVTVENAAATGIQTNTKETTQVSLYPNPNIGLFTLQITNVSAAFSKAQINIRNILGEVIYSAQESLNNNVLIKEIDLQNLSNGAYFMQVTMGNKVSTNKIIINK